MQSLEYGTRCNECSTMMMDDGDEFVCPSCGIVREKMVIEAPSARLTAGGSLSVVPLGSFMGSSSPTSGERHSTGFSRANSTYRYLKLISDFGGREENGVYVCTRLIERVCDRLSLPSVVAPQAVSVAKKLLTSIRRDRRVTLATVSAYATIAACRMGGFTSVSSREILEAHAALGRHVKTSSIIRLTIEAPFRVPSRKPEEYISRTLARLSENDVLVKKLEVGGIAKYRYFNTLREAALELLGSLAAEVKEGHRPSALAATSVYSAEVLLSFRESRKKLFTQRETAQCGDTAEYTVREQYRKMFMAAVENLKGGSPPTPSPTTGQ